MLIDVPVLIAFDCKDQYAVPRAPGRVIFTLRYDTTDTDVRAQWCASYPPPANAHWVEDEHGVLFAFLTSSAEKKIAEAAAKFPTDYCADAKEGEILEEEIEQQRAANGRSGVGA